MNYIRKYIGVYVAFLIQTLIFEKISIFSCPPDVLLTVLIITTVGISPVKATFLGAFAGLVTDVMSGRILGINVLIYMYLALFVSLTAGERTNNSPLLMSWVSFISIATLEIALGVIKGMLGYFPGVGFILSSIFVKGIFAAVFTLLSILLCLNMKKKKAQKELPREEAAV